MKGINNACRKLLLFLLVFLFNIRNIAAEIRSIGIILLRISFDSWLTRKVPMQEPKKDNKNNNLMFFSFSKLFLYYFIDDVAVPKHD